MLGTPFCFDVHRSSSLALDIFIIGETVSLYKKKIESLSKTPARKGLTNDTGNDTII